MFESSNQMEILYVRHARSESNQDDDAGVHIYDTFLVAGVSDVPLRDKPYGEGRSYCKMVLRPELAKLDKPLTHIAVSPLSRCIQTMMLSVPLATLATAKITILPIITEQTEWMSDRGRYVKQIRTLIEKELRARAREENSSPPKLNINYNLLFRADSDPETSRKEFERFEKRHALTKAERKREEDELELKMREDELHWPWQTKTGFYSVARVRDRADQALKTLAFWGITARQQAGEEKELRFAVFGHGGIINYMDEIHGEIGSGPGKLTSWKYGQTRMFTLNWKLKNKEMTTGRLVWVRDNKKPQSSHNPEEERKKRQKEKENEDVIFEDIKKRAGSALRQDAKYGELYKKADAERKNPKEAEGLSDEYMLEHIGI